MLNDIDSDSDNGEEGDKCDAVKRKHNLSMSDIQRIRIERLMSHPDKPAHIPEPRQPKMPRAFEPHEFVRNVMGASAGAGSGEFDIYRGCRRRQRIRQDFLYYQEKQKLANEEWRRRVEERQGYFDMKREKKRNKRMKAKDRIRKKKVANNKDKSIEAEVASDSVDTTRRLEQCEAT